jgi:hypothetical protein
VRTFHHFFLFKVEFFYTCLIVGPTVICWCSKWAKLAT